MVNAIFSLNTRGQSITIVLFLCTLIGIIIALTLGGTTNTYLIIALVLLLFFISFIYPDFAIILIMLSTFFLPDYKIGQTPTRPLAIRSEDILLLVVIAGWLAKIAIHKEISLLKHTLLNRPILAYSIMCLVSSFIALINGHSNPKDALFFLLKYFEYFFLFFMVVNNCKTWAQAKRLIYAIILTYFLVSIWGLRQIPGGGRISAPFGGNEPNTLSGYLILMMGLNLGLLLHAPSSAKRLLYLFLLASSFLPFLFTLSRGGMIAFLPMLFTLVVCTKKLKMALLVISLAFLMTLPVLLPSSVQKRLRDIFAPETNINVLGKKINISESAAHRLSSWNRAHDALKVHPFIGVGVPGGGTTDGQFPRVLIEVGLVGFAFFTWMLLALFKAGFASYKETAHNALMQGVSLGFIAGLVGLLFHSLSAASFIIIRIMQPFWILAGVIAVLPEIEKENLEGISEGT